MTRKDYEAIAIALSVGYASALKQIVGEYHGTDRTNRISSATITYDAMLHTFVALCRHDNPNFNEIRFRRYCDALMKTNITPEKALANE